MYALPHSFGAEEQAKSGIRFGISRRKAKSFPPTYPLEPSCRREAVAGMTDAVESVRELLLQAPPEEGTVKCRSR